MHTLSHEELQAMLGQLEQAVRSHEQWFDELNRVMLCRLPYDPRDMDPEAYRLCAFGQWLYQHAHPKLRAHPAMQIIENVHEEMHHHASKLLAHAERAQAVAPEEYDAFMRALQQLRLEISTLRQELQGILLSVDLLTGARSRTGMLTYMREQQEMVNRGAQSVAIAMLDLDLFKQVNDRYGHPSGDRVLTVVVRYILENIRPYDRLFRYGGEEFLLCMQHTDAEVATIIAERIRTGVAALRIDNDGTEALAITLSAGVAELAAGLTVEEAIIRADQALYEAKTAGRNRIRRWRSATAAPA